MKPENEKKVEIMTGMFNDHFKTHGAGVRCQADCPISSEEGVKKMASIYARDLERSEREV